MKSRKILIVIVALLLITVGTILTLYLIGNEKKEQQAMKTELKLNDVPLFQVYSNAALTVSIADPFVLKAGNGTYYMYGTTDGAGYKVFSSKDLINWRDAGTAFAGWNAKWAGGSYWAPEVVEKDDKYYMYYTASVRGSRTLRIGVAVSDKPEGPFEDVSDKPLVDFGYAAIDANVLKDDDGRYYLYFSRDCSENVVNGRNESHIYGIEMNNDMISLKGESVKLLQPDTDWEFLSGDCLWNEGPSSFKKNGVYYIMYSANCYDTRDYGVGYATSKSPLEGFVKSETNPVLTATTYENNKVSGPGHNNIVMTEDGMYTVYHRHINPDKGSGPRQYSIDQMGVREDGTIYVNGPSINKLPVPFIANGLKNAALEAEVTVSSTKSGFNPKGAFDREAVLDKRNEKYEWVAADEDEKPVLSLKFPQPKKISSIIIYGSFDENRRDFEVAVTINGTSVIKGVRVSSIKGEPTILSFDEMDVTDLKFDFERAEVKSEIGISEIVAVSK